MLISLSVYDEINSHCPPLSNPHLRANPLLACCAWLHHLQTVQTALCKCHLSCPKTARTERSALQCSAAQILDPEGRFISTMPCPARWIGSNVDPCPAIFPRSRFDPAQPESITITCMQRGAQCGRIPLPLQYGGTAARLDVWVA